jgi:hypothetical protein
LAATLPVLIAGCGTGAVSTAGLSGTQKAIATTISNFQSDAETNDTSKLCSTDLAPALVRSLSTGGHTCTSVLSSQLKIVDAFSLSLANDSIKVTGNNATAVVQDTYSGKTTHQDTITLVKSGTVWKISGIAG